MRAFKYFMKTDG